MNNILYFQNQHHRNVNNCKIHFLKEENKWMELEQKYLDQLIVQFKNIIKLTTTDSSNFHTSQDLLKKLNQNIKQHINSIDSTFKQQHIQQYLQLEINLTQRQSIIQQAQNYIKLIQNLLIKVKLKTEDYQKTQHNGCLFMIQQDKSITFKKVECYDISDKITFKYKYLIQNLKKKKNQLVDLLENNVYNNRMSEFQQEKTMKDTPRTDGDSAHYEYNDEQINDFEKTILILKQKKFSNRKMKQKIQNLKKQIENKKYCIDKINQNNDDSLWDFSLKGPGNGKHIIDSQIGDLSMEKKDTYIEQQIDLDLEFSTIQPVFGHKTSSLIP